MHTCVLGGDKQERFTDKPFIWIYGALPANLMDAPSQTVKEARFNR